MAPPPGMGAHFLSATLLASLSLPMCIGPPGTFTPAAPGIAPPGVQFNGPPAGPRGLPAGFQPPGGLPTGINFNAPVIRLGTSASQRSAMDGMGGRRESAATPARRGLGMDGSDSGARRDESKMPPRAPTREEISRTIFVGNIPEGVSDEGVEAILRAAGSLTRFYRATDANDKLQTFGFAEFSDAQSLRTATEIFKDVRLPIKRQKPGVAKKEEGAEDEEKEKEKVETTKLQIMVDDASIKYAEEWTKNEDENTLQFRIDAANETLTQVVAQIFNPPSLPQIDTAGDVKMQDLSAQNGVDVPFYDIGATTGEDELSDIPVEMRETVAAEIAAFRDRSNKRDQERLKREEEIEAEQRRRDGRRASPPASAPTGPGGANGVPVGPRADRGIQGVPSGPKGSQFPRDYQSGVNFVNGGTVNGGAYISREDEDDSASDSEVERRRKKKQAAELDDAYKNRLSRWLKHETRTVSSLERTHNRSKNEEAEKQALKDAQAAQLKNFDDDVEASQKRHMYYRDHSEYMRERQKIREREERDDRVDRDQENRELAAKQRQKDYARHEADAFLDQQAEEMLRVQEPRGEAQQIKISFGNVAKKLEQTAGPRRTAADVENLLEDEEVTDQPGAKKRTLIPINFEAAASANLTQEEVEDAQRQLARDIPNDKAGLWTWPVSWTHLLDKHIENDIKVWTANKVLESLGVQEDMLVDAVVEHLKGRGSPQDLVENLEVALDDEAESLVKKLWRMVIYYSETERRGIK
jgi:RNA-binding protein 25